jgi:hypothetical protein
MKSLRRALPFVIGFAVIVALGVAAAVTAQQATW